MDRPLLVVGEGLEADQVTDLLRAIGYPAERVTPDHLVPNLVKRKPRLLLVEIGGSIAAAEELTQRVQTTAYGALVPVVFFGEPPGPNPAKVVAMGGDVFIPLPVEAPVLESCARRLAGAPPERPDASALPPPPGEVDPLEALDLPWEGLDEPWARPRPGDTPADEKPDLLGEALAADDLLDPRQLAEEITRQKAPPPGSPHRGPVEVEVPEFARPDSDGDTVAVRIRRTISAYEEQWAGPEPESRTPAPDTTAPGPQYRPPPPVPDEPSLLPEDDIDLDALDVDTIARVERAPAHSVIEKLEEGLEELPPPPPSGSFPVVTRGTRTRSGTDSSLASPYDLPGVIATAQRRAAGVTDELEAVRDRLDTVPGHRTAVILTQGGERSQERRAESEDLEHAQRTQPAKRLDAGGEPAGDTPVEERTPGPEEWPEPRDTPADPLPPSAPREVPTHLREGDLADLDPARLLWELCTHALTGVLTVESDGARYTLAIENGVPRHVQSSRRADRMLEMLRRAGMITGEQAIEAEEMITHHGRRAGAVLLDRGWIKPAELIPTVRWHLEDLLFAVFALESGTFRFESGALGLEEIVFLERRPAALVLEGIRRKYSVARIVGMLGTDQAVPARVPEADEALLAGASLSGQDWRLIDAMDGRQTVAQLAHGHGASAQDVWALAWALQCLGLVSLRRVGGGELPSPGQPRAERDFRIDLDRLLARHSLAREGDYFACLGVAPEASLHEIRQAYQDAMAQFSAEELHPQIAARYGRELDEVREVIEEAWDVLGDEALGQRYRDHLRESSSGEAP